MKRTLDDRIDGLRPGESIEISRTRNGWVLVERSCDGKRIRFVRCTRDGFRVFLETRR